MKLKVAYKYKTDYMNHEQTLDAAVDNFFVYDIHSGSR